MGHFLQIFTERWRKEKGNSWLSEQLCRHILRCRHIGHISRQNDLLREIQFFTMIPLILLHASGVGDGKKFISIPLSP